MLKNKKDLENLELLDVESEQVVTENNYTYNPVVVDDRLRQSINYFKQPLYYLNKK